MEIKERVDRLNSSSWDISLHDSDKGYCFAKEALKLSRESHYDKGVVDSLINLGWIYISKSNYTLSSFLFQKAKEISLKADYYNGVLKSMTGISACNYYWGNYATCIDINIETVILARKYNDHVRLMTALTNSSSIYIKLGNKDKSLELAREAIESGKNINKNSEQNYVLSKNLGDAYRLVKEYEKSRIELLKACSISKEIDYLQGYYEARCSLGKLYSDIGKLEKARLIFSDIFLNCRDMLNASDLFLDISNFYYDLNDYSKSLYYLEISLESAKKYSMNQVVLGVYELYIKIYEKLERLDKVTFYFNLTRDLIDREKKNKEAEKEKYNRYYSFIN